MNGVPTRLRKEEYVSGMVPRSRGRGRGRSILAAMKDAPIIQVDTRREEYAPNTERRSILAAVKDVPTMLLREGFAGDMEQNTCKLARHPIPLSLILSST